MNEDLEKQAKSYQRRLNRQQNIVNKAWPINVPSFQVKRDKLKEILDEIDQDIFYVESYKDKNRDEHWKVHVMTESEKIEEMKIREEAKLYSAIRELDNWFKDMKRMYEEKKNAQ